MNIIYVSSYYWPGCPKSLYSSYISRIMLLKIIDYEILHCDQNDKQTKTITFRPHSS